MGYYLAPSLATLRAEINARWPGRDKTSDGWIGDPAHQATRSDHNPNERGSVNAIDVDEDGIDVYAVIAAFERHPSAHYWIYERQIADRDDGWRRRPYYGSNPHDKHVHFSIRQAATAEQDTRPWGLLEDDMSLFTERHAAAILYTDGRVEAMAHGRPTVRADLVGGGQPVWTVQAIKALADAVGKVDEAVAAQLADEFARIEAEVAAVGAPDPKAIAAAIPPELAQQVADELARRLAGADTPS